jgi:hypothetical protein
MVKILTILFLMIAGRCQAQTAFYLEATGTQYGATGALSSWESTGSAVISSANPTGTKSSSTIASTTIAVANALATDETMFGQFISPALKAQTISGTVTGYARMSIANTTGATVQSRIKITVISRTGAVVATLLAITAGASNLTTTLTSYQIANAAALSSYSCADGDRICIEIGIGRSSGTTSRNGVVSFGSSSATDISAAGSTTANNPVVIFSGTITFLKGTPAGIF